MSRLAWLFLGVLLTVVVAGCGGYLFLRMGGVPMATTAQPLPLERTVARLALHASYASARDQKDPLPFNEANMVGGAHVYTMNCVVCHGTPGQPRSDIARGMFPAPPQLFDKDEMVTDDPEGITFWKVTNGIRLSGMPGFLKTLSETDRWQVTLLVSHADRLTPAVERALKEP
jgi:mono/diheme cytochrome c family protein